MGTIIPCDTCNGSSKNSGAEQIALTVPHTARCKILKSDIGILQVDVQADTL